MDPRFIRLPQNLIDEIAKVPPTSMPVGGTLHEVQFNLKDMMCQVAVVNGTHVALPQAQVDEIVGIRKIWSKEELGL